jgi:glucose/mannose transport system permease protein
MKAPLVAKVALSPSVLLIGACVYGYIAFTFYLSFTGSTMMPVMRLTGTEAYSRLMSLGNWHLSVVNLGVFAALYMLGCAALGLFLAVLLDQRIRAESVFRSIYLYPMALSFIVTGTAWKWIMDPSIGLERSLRAIGWDSFAFGWVKDSDLVIYCVVLAAVWQTSGFVMAIFLAGLRGVDNEVINAARLDGAKPWRIYQRVVFPQLGACFVSAFVILAHMAIKSYDLVIALTGGGPGRASWLPSLFMYQYTFTRNEMAVGAASAILMLAASAIVVIPYIRREIRQDRAHG